MDDLYQRSDFNQSLDETVVWCSSLVATVLEQTPALEKYFEVMERWRRLMKPTPIWKRWFRRRRESELFRLTSSFVSSMPPRFRTPCLFGDADTEALKTNDDWQEAVRSVRQNRHQLLQARGITPTTDERNGRLLLYWPVETVADGASEYASRACSMSTMLRHGICGFTSPEAN